MNDSSPDNTLSFYDEEAVSFSDLVSDRESEFLPTRPPAKEIREGHIFPHSPTARAALTLARRPHTILVGGSCLHGGTEACEEIYGADGVLHDGTTYQRGGAKHDVAITGGSRRITWDRCQGLRWITAGDYSSADQTHTGPPVRDCVIYRAPFEERPIVFCLNSEAFGGDALNIRIPWRWLHFRLVDGYFWFRRKWEARARLPARTTNPRPARVLQVKASGFSKNSDLLGYIAADSESRPR